MTARPDDATSYASRYLDGACRIAELLDRDRIEMLVSELARCRDRGGRVFILGVGGSAANASHAASDMRKLAAIEAYCATDNVAELTARTNDEGWERTLVDWLRVSRITARDAVLILSVGGGDLTRGISPNLVRAVDLAKTVGARVLGILGRDGGHTAAVGDVCVIIPTVDPENVTTYSESFQAIIWHLIVSHPRLRSSGMRWESVR